MVPFSPCFSIHPCQMENLAKAEILMARAVSNTLQCAMQLRHSAFAYRQGIQDLRAQDRHRVKDLESQIAHKNRSLKDMQTRFDRLQREKSEWAEEKRNFEENIKSLESKAKGLDDELNGMTLFSLHEQGRILGKLCLDGILSPEQVRAYEVKFDVLLTARVRSALVEYERGESVTYKDLEDEREEGAGEEEVEVTEEHSEDVGVLVPAESALPPTAGEAAGTSENVDHDVAEVQ